MSRGQKWAQFEKGYLPSDCNSDTKIEITGEAGDDISVCKGILKNRFFDQVRACLKIIVIGPYFL